MKLLWMLLLAAAGFANALFLYIKKKRNEKPACYLGSNCNRVIRSKYATTLGIDNTVLGMVYYVFLVAAIVLASPFMTPLPIMLLATKLMASIAALMSLYLLGIQVFVLREYCDYCLLAAVINLALLAVLFW